jgi:hypothetical protein
MPESNRSISFNEASDFVMSLQSASKTSKHLAGMLLGLKALMVDGIPELYRCHAWECAAELCAALEPEDSQFFGRHEKRPDLRTAAAGAAYTLEHVPNSKDAHVHALNIYKALAGERGNLRKHIEPVSMYEAAYFLFQVA